MNENRSTTRRTVLAAKVSAFSRATPFGPETREDGGGLGVELVPVDPTRIWGLA